jgi:transcriptional regulator with XRE-family HTH domain
MTSNDSPVITDHRRTAYGPSLLALREARGMTRAALAARAGITKNYLWRIETGGRTTASEPVLIALAAALRVEVNAITRPVVYVDISDSDWPDA